MSECLITKVLYTVYQPVSPSIRSSVCLLHSDHPHRDDGVGESFLFLHSQDLQAGLKDDVLHNVQVTDDAAVDGIQLAALPGHVVLNDDNPVGPQTLLTAHQELHQVPVRQVTWRWDSATQDPPIRVRESQSVCLPACVCQTYFNYIDFIHPYIFSEI